MSRKLLIAAAVAPVMFSSVFGRSFHFNTPKPGDDSQGGTPPATLDPKALTEEYNRLKDEWESFATKPNLSADQKTAQATRFNRMGEIVTTLEQIRTLAGHAIDAAGEGDEGAAGEGDGAGEGGEGDGEGDNSYNRKPPALPNMNGGQRKPKLDSFNISSGKTRDAIAKERREQFNAALRGDPKAMQKFTINTASGSGIMVPTEVAVPHVVRKNHNQIRAALAMFGLKPQTSSAYVNLNVPIFDDDSNEAEDLTDGEGTGTEANPTITGLNLEPKLTSSKQIWISNTTLGAPGYDVGGYILPVLTKRVDLKQEKTAFTKLKATGVTGTTIASAADMAYEELIDWEHSLRSSYRSDAVAFVSSDGMKLLRLIRDDNGRPLLEVDPETKLMKFHNHYVLETDNLDTAAAGNTIGVLASVEALQIFDAGVQRVTRYVNIPDHEDDTGFALFVNGDFGFVPDGVRLLKVAEESSSSGA